MLFSIIGTMGSGKTLLATLIALSVPNSVKIYSNYCLNIPNYEPLEPENLMDEKISDALIIIDEGYVWLESRTSGKKANRFLSYILYQSRKKNLDFIITMQDKGTIDRRFRTMSDIMIFCQKNDKLKQFEYTFFIKRLFDYLSFTRILNYDNAKKYYKYYETKQIIETPQMKKMSFDFICDDNQKLDKVINEACSKLHYVTHITKDNIERELIRNNYPKEITKYVYAQLKNNQNNEK